MGTIGKCRNICFGAGYRFAAMQNGNECYCDDSYSKYGQLADSECSVPCSGNNAEFCGAKLKNSVYTAEAIASTGTEFGLNLDTLVTGGVSKDKSGSFGIGISADSDGVDVNIKTDGNLGGFLKLG